MAAAEGQAELPRLCAPHDPAFRVFGGFRGVLGEGLGVFGIFGYKSYINYM